MGKRWETKSGDLFGERGSYKTAEGVEKSQGILLFFLDALPGHPDSFMERDLRAGCKEGVLTVRQVKEIAHRVLRGPTHPQTHERLGWPSSYTDMLMDCADFFQARLGGAKGFARFLDIAGLAPKKPSAESEEEKFIAELEAAEKATPTKAEEAVTPGV